MLLIAARYQFDRVIGVELSEPLIRIATANIGLYARKHPGLRPIELVHTDVCQVRAAAHSLRVVSVRSIPGQSYGKHRQSGSTSFLANPRKLFIIYYFPAFAHVFEAPFMRRHDITDLPSGSMNRYGKPTRLDLRNAD